MRTFFALAILIASVGASSGAQQTPVIVRTPMSTGLSTDEQLRNLRMRILEVSAANQKRQTQLVQSLKDSSMSPAGAALEEEIVRNVDLMMRLTSQLAVECARRRSEGGINGTLGLQLHDPATSIVDIDNQSLTFVFSTVPVIDSIVRGSPADKAGVHMGDIWTKANGRPLLDSVRFDEMMKPGSQVTIMVRRAGKEMELKPMTVAKREFAYPADLCDATDLPSLSMLPPRISTMRVMPVRPLMPSGQPPFSGQMQMFIMASPGMGYAGARLQPLDNDWRELSGLQGDGIVVTEVAGGSPADMAGLRKFDVIRQINGEAVATMTVFSRIAAEQRKLVFTVIHKGENGSRTVTIATR